jgi:hypothetical protein
MATPMVQGGEVVNESRMEARMGLVAEDVQVFLLARKQYK